MFNLDTSAFDKQRNVEYTYINNDKSTCLRHTKIKVISLCVSICALDASVTFTKQQNDCDSKRCTAHCLYATTTYQLSTNRFMCLVTFAIICTRNM